LEYSSSGKGNLEKIKKFLKVASGKRLDDGKVKLGGFLPLLPSVTPQMTPNQDRRLLRCRSNRQFGLRNCFLEGYFFRISVGLSFRFRIIIQEKTQFIINFLNLIEKSFAIEKKFPSFRGQFRVKKKKIRRIGWIGS
jgi:predicted Kef-type K+ transport protein